MRRRFPAQAARGVRLSAVVLTGWALLAIQAGAVTSTWKPGGPSSDWYDPLNWTAGVPQTAGDIARFSLTATSATQQAQLNAPASVAQLSFTGRGFARLSGTGPLTFSDPAARTQPQLIVSAQTSTLEATVEVPIILPAGETLLISHQGQATTKLIGPISGAGSITYLGTAPLYNFTIIQGDNAYTGVTAVEGGRHIDAVSPTAFGAATGETIIRNGSVGIAGTSEPFVVERDGMLLIHESAIPTTGRITLAGGTLIPDSRFQHDEIDNIQIDSEIEIRGRGYVGRSPSSSNAADLRGDVTGGGRLLIEGSSNEFITFHGEISLRGDVQASDRSYAAIVGDFAPAGDLIVDGGIAFAQLRLEGNTSEFNGDVETRLGYLTLASDMTAEHLRVDARMATYRATLNQGGVTIEEGATLDVDSLEFYAGDISGRLTGVDEITKRTRLPGKLSRLEGFDGVIAVEEGWLEVLDARGLGTVAGGTSVESRERAAVVLNDGVRVEETINLSNSAGLNYQGALLGSGEMAGRLQLGDQGSYVGGSGGEDEWGSSRGGNLHISGSIEGGALRKSGTSTKLTISGGGHTYTGPTEILGGDLILTNNAHLASTAAIHVGGGRISSSGQPTATLQFDDRGITRSQDRLADHVPVHLKSGRIRLQGQAGSEETLGAVVLEGGWNRIEAAGGVLRANQLDRRRGAVAAFMRPRGDAWRSAERR